ncbi:hypothetical protein [Micromonospora halophytica]|uniref:Uncharacterized protein n=1 Tax=Micromonospora halophytica TaxID=47864 RepID=A0A1C5IYS8_9ACTN|nr:hypothetical protein [Micromonospora halophytica]SCG63171.1 hypothetical protein GA0070560_11838 [Micromonospora halophytica]
MSHVNFLGIPVQGDITRRRRIVQRPLAELQPLLRALLDDEAVVEFGWQQCTPYFNDGEPCEFAVDGFWVRTTADAPDTGPEDLCVGEYEDPHPTLGWRGRKAGRQHPYTGPDELRYERARALADALTSGGFNDVLLDAFGDHALVGVRRDGITVTFYEHE